MKCNNNPNGNHHYVDNQGNCHFCGVPKIDWDLPEDVYNSLDISFLRVIELCQRSMQEFGDIGDDDALKVIEVYHLTRIKK